MAEEKITEATAKLATMATGINSRATGQWDKLEGIFEDRVAKALGKLGIPSAKDVAALSARIAELEKQLGKKPVAKAAAKKAARPPAKRAPARKTA